MRVWSQQSSCKNIKATNQVASAETSLRREQLLCIPSNQAGADRRYNTNNAYLGFICFLF